MKLSETQLRQVLHIAHPQLYDAAVAQRPVFLTLLNEKGKVCGEGVKEVNAAIEIRENKARIVIARYVSWVMTRRATSVTVCVALGEQLDPVHSIHTVHSIHRYMRANKREVLHVTDLKIEAWAVP